MAVSVALITGCATGSRQQVGASHGKLIGCGTGAAAGALIGAFIGNKQDRVRNAAIGAFLGGAAGCYLGALWQERELALQQVAREEGLAIQVETLDVDERVGGSGGALVAQVKETGMFATGSASLTLDGRRQVQKIAEAFAQMPAKNANSVHVQDPQTYDHLQERRFLVVGHTDATGGASLNKQLSEQRAREVGKVLQAAGIPAEHIFYQGAGSSRPVADNSTAEGRGLNRRVEISELSSEEVLVRRVKAEAANAKYLAHGTTTKAAPAGRPATGTLPAKAAAITPSQSKQPSSAPIAAVAPVASTAPAKPSANRNGTSLAKVDFGGVPAAQVASSVGRGIQPKSGGFALISSAQASEIPVQSCSVDAPRETGEVRSLVSDQAIKTYRTHEYMVGYNNRVWAQKVNGHLVTISPVSILKDDAAVDRQPFLQVVQNYGTSRKTTLKPIQAVANTYEGETQVLYRVFAKAEGEAVSCIDVVFDKRNATASDGQLFYPNGSATYAAEYVPIKS